MKCRLLQILLGALKVNMDVSAWERNKSTTTKKQKKTKKKKKKKKKNIYYY